MDSLKVDKMYFLGAAENILGSGRLFPGGGGSENFDSCANLGPKLSNCGLCIITHRLFVCSPTVVECKAHNLPLLRVSGTCRI